MLVSYYILLIFLKDKYGNPSELIWGDVHQVTYEHNLDADPYELNNLIGIKEFNTITKKLRDKLTQYINKHENLKTNIKKANNVNNPGQLGLNPGSFMDGY